MKEKLLSLTIILTVVSVLGFGFYTTFASNSGYDAYKEALKETHKMKSGNANIELTISNNDTVIQKLTVQTAHNLDEQRGKATIDLKTSDQSLQLDVHSDTNNVYVNNGEATYVIESNRDPAEIKEKHEKYHNKELMNIAELVVDTLTRPLHDSFVLHSNNIISLDIKNDDIPTVIHAMGSYMVKKGLKHHSDIEMTSEDYPFLPATLKQDFPALSDEITFDQIKVNAELTEDGLIKNQQAYFQISGIDQEGIARTLNIQLTINFDGINETSVTPLNIDPNNLEKIQIKKVHDFH